MKYQVVKIVSGVLRRVRHINRPVGYFCIRAPASEARKCGGDILIPAGISLRALSRPLDKAGQGTTITEWASKRHTEIVNEARWDSDW